MMTRREMLIGTGLALGAAVAGPSRAIAASTFGEEGLYTEPWFLASFLQLAEDLQDAKQHGKRLAVMWELRGCPYCRETHLVNLAQERIVGYIRAHFEVLQLNIIGAREVTDFDGEVLTEKALAAKYGVKYTPTFQFFPDSVEGLAAKPAPSREVARAAGYLQPDDFLALFRFVQEKAYTRQSLRDFLKASRS